MSSSKQLEFRYFLSNSVNISARLMVASLEQPAGTLGEHAAEAYLTAQIWCDGRPVHSVPMSTHVPSRSSHSEAQWDEWVVLPMKYRDLSRSAMLAMTVWSATGKPLGGTTLAFFDADGVLRTGLQKLVLWPGVEADGSVNSATLGHSAALDDAFRFERAREQYERGEMRPVSWLDQLAFERMDGLRGASMLLDEGLGWSGGVAGGHSSCDGGVALRQLARGGGVLSVILPTFGSPVLYECEAYANAPAPLPALLALHGSGADGVGARAGTLGGDTGSGATTLGAPSGAAPARWAAQLVLIDDAEVDAPNPVELKYRKLARDLLRGLIDRDLQPNREEKTQIAAIIGSPSFDLRDAQKDLLWKFRFSLTGDKRALTKFLLCVDWNEQDEVKQVEELLGRWAPIDTADALKLLGREREFANEVVRRFAVLTLGRASDEELLDYLLQLVQALRYEGPGSTVFDEGAGAAATAASPDTPTHLAEFLVNRAMSSFDLANYLYWFLRVELSIGEKQTSAGQPSSLSTYRKVFNSFGGQMSSTEQGINIFTRIKSQADLVQNIARVHLEAKRVKGRKEPKELELRRLLKELPQPQGPVSLPLEPSIKVDGFRRSTAKMYKSAMYPCVIEFKRCADSRPGAEGDSAGLLDMTHSIMRSLGAQQRGGELFPVIFKHGDDLRQDQLILQLFGIMDKLLKRVNLDLKLTPFKVLATSADEGLLECVQGSINVSAVLAQNDNDILSFFRKKHPSEDPADAYGVRPEVIDTYVKSTAGYCVITYLLGIGDRHLDNLMLKVSVLCVACGSCSACLPSLLALCSSRRPKYAHAHV